jgi:hypothetical protein
VRHYRVKRGRAFWEPTAKMKAAGFESKPLGPDGPEAVMQAEQWNKRWDDSRTGQRPSPALASASNLAPDEAENLTVYPPRSFGAGFRDYRSTAEWAKKSPKTREEWHRGWKWIKPVFGDVDPRTVTLAQISEWRETVAGEVSNGEAWRAHKIWRALWKVCAALQLCSRDADPSLAVRNSAPKGRRQQWAEGEAVRLVKRAWRMGFRGLAAAMACGWDAQLEVGDLRALRASQMATGGPGSLFFTQRGKTGVPVGGLLSARSMAVLAAYLDQLGAELLGDAFLFRTRTGEPYSSDRLNRDFAIVREAEFGPLEARTFGHDFRRSGAGEAIAGDATPASLAHAMGNTLSSSNALFATYVPVNAATIRSVQQARLRGRKRLRS